MATTVLQSYTIISMRVIQDFRFTPAPPIYNATYIIHGSDLRAQSFPSPTHFSMPHILSMGVIQDLRVSPAPPITMQYIISMIVIQGIKVSSALLIYNAIKIWCFTAMTLVG